MSNNEKSIGAVKDLFSSRISILTTAISLAALSIFVLLRAISGAVYRKEIDLYASLYYMFGSGSVIAVNIVMGILTAVVIFAIVVGLFSARFSISRAGTPSAQSLGFLKIATLSAIILTILTVIISFASVTVLNYASIQENGGSSSYYLMNRYSSQTAATLFWLTILIGGILILAEVSFLRFLFALSKTINGQGFKRNGMVVSIVADIASAVTTVIAFAIALYNLVTPSKEYAYNLSRDLPAAGLQPSTLISNTLDVIVFAAATVAFIALSVFIISYSVDMDRIQRYERTMAYNQNHSVTNAIEVPDYTAPQNYAYNQTTSFAPYYQANVQYQDVYRNIYTGETQPAPEPVQNPFMAQKTPAAQTPAAQTPAAQAPAAQAPAAQAPAAETPAQNNTNA